MHEEEQKLLRQQQQQPHEPHEQQQLLARPRLLILVPSKELATQTQRVVKVRPFTPCTQKILCP